MNSGDHKEKAIIAMNCTFNHNTGEGHGAVYIDGSIDIVGSAFVNSTAAFHGGGLTIVSTNTSISVSKPQQVH